MAIRLASLAARQSWLDPLAEAIESRLRRGLEALGPRRQRVEAILHGDRLGHPLHIMLTDVPLGAWTTALACDGIGLLSRRDAWDSAARIAVGVGVAGALGAAVAGLADWSRLDGANRRVGLAHGLLNTLGVTLFAASWVRRRRGGGKLLALGGFLVAGAAARLGGYLVYQAGVAAQPAALAPPSSERAA